MDPKPSRREEPSSRKRKAPSSSSPSPSGTHPDPDPEQQKAASSSSFSSGTHPHPDPEIQKVCIVCSTDPETFVEGQSDCFHLYIVDLAANVSENVGDNRVFDHKSPTYRIGDDFPSDAMCALGSTLYMFDGFSPRDKPGRGKIPYMYKLPANVSTIEDFRLERGMLTEIPSMHQAKSAPVAIVTPDKKKIVVFSSKISPQYTDVPFSDFEMFQPNGECGGSWKKLAWVPRNRRQSTFHISAYTFMDENILLLQTNKGKMFTVDLRWRDQPWKLLHVNSPQAPLLIEDLGYFVLIGGGLHLTKSFVCDYDKEERDEVCFYYPELCPRTNYYPNVRGITLLHCDARQCNFCVIESVIGRGIDLYPPLTVNLYKLDISEFKKAKEELMKAYIDVLLRRPLPGTCTKSFKFSLNKEHNLREFLFPTMLFPIQ